MRPKGTGILYLLKDRFQIYINLIPNIPEYKLSQDSVRDLTVTDKEKLEKAIIKFIEAEKLPVSNLIFVIADNVSYNKEFQIISQGVTSEEQAKSCLKHVPFEAIISKTIQTPQGFRVFATNKDIFSVLKEAFEQKGFEIDFVMPGLVYENAISAQPDLTLESAAIIFKQTLSLKQNNLLPPSPFEDGQIKIPEDPERKAGRKKDILRLYAYTSIFGMLIIGLIVVWNISNPLPSHNYKSKAGNQNVITLPSLQETKNLTVEIVNSSGSPLLAEQIKETLVKYAFKSVIVENQTKTVQSKDLIVFSDKPSLKVRAAVFTDIKQIRPNITAQNNPAAVIDIIIILGK